MDRQKMLMIFGGAWLSAALLTWLVYSMTKAPKSDKVAAIIAAARDLPAGTRLRKGDVKLVKVGDKDIVKGALTDEKFALDHPLLFPVTLNEPITISKLASTGGAEGVASLIEPGKRAVSVAINDVSGAAGLILPRSHVDVLFTKPGSMAEAVTATVLQDAVVLSVGRLTEVVATPAAAGSSTSSTTAAATAPASNQTRAVTLLVTPEQAEKLELAKNQGKVSLSLRNPLDKDQMNDAGATTTASLFSPNALRQRGQQLKGKSLWSSMTGDEERPKKIEKPIKEPPPKPRNVVDVYRGEKHVQEIFQ